jgi:hypothetical protein
MADTTDDGSNKRQRLTSYHRIMNIRSLPDDTLAAVSKFLPKPSRALFVVAMTSPSLTRKKPWKLPKLATTNQAILSLNSSTIGRGIEDEQGDDGEYWTTLDFVDIDETLANKLTDDDIAGALICIDAVNRLKSLKLTGCVNIKGTGLKPLKGSKVLEQIDMSFLKRNDKADEKYRSKPLPRLSVQCVEAVLNSIIDANGSSLKHVVFPKKFVDPPNSSLSYLIRKYADFLARKGGTCSKCNKGVWGNKSRRFDHPWIEQERISPWYGTQNFTCYDCINHYCKHCVRRCDRCEKESCMDCTGDIDVCRSCSDILCKLCGVFTDCDECGASRCHKCTRNGICHGCGTTPFQRWNRNLSIFDD